MGSRYRPGTVVTKARPMNPQLLLSALPWVRRIWKVLPPALRVPVLVAAAAGALWYAMQGREEIEAQRASDPSLG